MNAEWQGFSCHCSIIAPLSGGDKLESCTAWRCMSGKTHMTAFVRQIINSALQKVHHI